MAALIEEIEFGSRIGPERPAQRFSVVEGNLLIGAAVGVYLLLASGRKR